MNKYNLITILLALFFLQACDEEIVSPIPYAPVNLVLDLKYEDSNLVSPLTYKIFTKKRFEEDKLGFGGILVINGRGENMLINLFAYDLACPVEVDRNIRIVPNDLGQAVCPHCGAVYMISNGSGATLSGSKNFLRTYRVSPQQQNDRYLVSH
ncbi:MAG: hypothetical protein LBP72_04435 [Dysgonamonadaceae bacterium]|jgi:hypothetical protein|nr:hypothetical protein [Dysgonamonadaceae bacterium]